MNTHRAYYGAQTILAANIRTGTVKATLGVLRVPVYAYGTACEVASLPATSPEAGKVTITVTDDILNPGLYRFAVESDGAVVQDGLLEVV